MDDRHRGAYPHPVCDLELKGTNYILSEMVDIAAWVFMWEAVDLFFLERKILKVEQLRACRLFGAEISYRSLSSG